MRPSGWLPATVDALVAEASARVPERPALADADGVRFTHAQLDEAVERAAAALRRRGAGRGTFVALLAERTPSAVLAYLAVLRAGAAYVPIDPRWPRLRQIQVLRQVHPTVFLASASLLKAAWALTDDVPELQHVIALDPTGFSAEQKAQTEEFWDFVASRPEPERAAGFNLREATVSTATVTAYLDHVTGLVKGEGGGGAVLELGCGSGLLAARLIAHSSCYVGIDPSSTAVERATREQPVSGDGHVATRFVQGFAHDATRLVDGTFDTVVLSSVVQFFPGPLYLRQVLLDCVSLLRPGGRIVLADLPVPGPACSGVPLNTFGDPVLKAALARVTVHERPPGSLDELGHRYDVTLSRGDRTHTPAAAAQLEPSSVLDLPVPAATTKPGERHTPDDLAYCIFTSGTTGKPKGVFVRHQPVVDVIRWVNGLGGLSEQDSVAMITSFAFDLSVWDMFGVLAAGACVQLVHDAEAIDPDHLHRRLLTDRSTIWDSAPAAMSLLLSNLEELAEGGEPLSPMPDLRLVLLSGDWVPLSMPARILRFFPEAEIVALGGATEATVWSNYHTVSDVDPTWRSIPYGRPMPSAQYHVLTADLAPVPPGQPGDLHIAGDCLADGYWSDPRLTAAKFRPDPFGPVGGRMYATGDRVRMMADGELEFLGRGDDQVKIRGYRIELGDVQAAICQHPEVIEARALVTGDRLARSLHLVYAGPRDLGTRVVRAFLNERLPRYAVPSSFRWVARLPLSPNGKVDVAALTAVLPASGADRRGDDAEGSRHG